MYQGLSPNEAKIEFECQFFIIGGMVSMFRHDTTNDRDRNVSHFHSLYILVGTLEGDIHSVDK